MFGVGLGGVGSLRIRYMQVVSQGSSREAVGGLGWRRLSRRASWRKGQGGGTGREVQSSPGEF